MHSPMKSAQIHFPWHSDQQCGQLGSAIMPCWIVDLPCAQWQRMGEPNDVLTSSEGSRSFVRLVFDVEDEVRLRCVYLERRQGQLEIERNALIELSTPS